MAGGCGEPVGAAFWRQVYAAIWPSMRRNLESQGGVSLIHRPPKEASSLLPFIVGSDRWIFQCGHAAEARIRYWRHGDCNSIIPLFADLDFPTGILLTTEMNPLWHMVLG
jgi:hypothetical protein